MDVTVEQYNGLPTVHVDGEPVTGLMNWNRYPSEDDTAIFRDAGVNFYSFMGNLFIDKEGVPDEELTTKDGAMDRMRLTHENIDKTMEMLVSVNPQIKVLPRIILNPPIWWLKENPDDVMVGYNVNTREYVKEPRACVTSEKWRSLWTVGLREVVEYFEERWSEHIIGYHTGMAHCGEHAYKWWDTICEFSKAQGEAFKGYLQGKYKEIGALNNAWKSSFADFSEVPLPEGGRFVDYTIRAPSLLLPETEMDLIDFQKFSSDVMAGTVTLEAEVVKKTLKQLDRKKLFGVFYGYINQVANSTQMTVGHNALTAVLRSPDVDFICGPLSYGARQNGGATMPQMIPGSIIANGKFFYNEDDTGTHVVDCPHHGYIPACVHDSIHVERRNFLETWRSGGSQWWMDLYGTGWFIDEKLRDEFARLRKFAEETLHDRKSRAEIAVFTSLESCHYLRDNPASLCGNLLEQQLFEIGAVGASYDMYQDEDIPLLARDGKLKQYKLCIFLNSVTMKEEIRALVKSELQCDGRTLLWFYAPGYIRNEERSAEAAEDLTGFKFSVLETGIMPMLTEAWAGDLRITYGLTRAVYPRLTGNDPQANTLGYFINGTTIVNRHNGNGAALMSKDMEGWRSVWSASPELPACLITRFAKEAGVHIFSERGDQVFFAGSWLGLHGKTDGERTIPLPGKFTVKNVITGDMVAEQTDRIDLELKRGETVLFSLSQ